MDFNPWHVESIEAFNFYCCPECVYRVQVILYQTKSIFCQMSQNIAKNLHYNSIYNT